MNAGVYLSKILAGSSHFRVTRRAHPQSNVTPDSSTPDTWEVPPCRLLYIVSASQRMLLASREFHSIYKLINIQKTDENIFRMSWQELFVSERSELSCLDIQFPSSLWLCFLLEGLETFGGWTRDDSVEIVFNDKTSFSIGDQPCVALTSNLLNESSYLGGYWEITH